MIRLLLILWRIYYQIILCFNLEIRFFLFFLHILYLTPHIFIRGVIFLNSNMNNMDMAKLMQMLSNMDKNQLEAGLAKANQILQSKSKEEILSEINKNSK